MRRTRAAELRLGIHRHIALIVDEHTLDKRAIISENTVNVLAEARAKLTCLIFKSVKREELIVLRGSVKYRFRIVCPENKHNVLIYRVSLWIYLFGVHERYNAILAGKISLKIANEISLEIRRLPLGIEQTHGIFRTALIGIFKRDYLKLCGEFSLIFLCSLGWYAHKQKRVQNRRKSGNDRQ